MPRNWATSWALRNAFNALNVAFTTLCGLEDPRLGQDIGDAGAFEHRTHRTSGNHTRTWRGWTNEYVRTCVLHFLGVRNGSVHKWNVDHVLLAILDAFLNGGGHFTAFAETVSHLALLVTDDDDGTEAESPTTLGGLGHTVDANQAVLQIWITGTRLLVPVSTSFLLTLIL